MGTPRPRPDNSCRSPDARRRFMKRVLGDRRRLVPIALATMVLAAGATAVAVAPSALAAGEAVNIWLTTTSDNGGRAVTRGLQQQAPVNFTADSGSADQTVT